MSDAPRPDPATEPPATGPAVPDPVADEATDHELAAVHEAPVPDPGADHETPVPDPVGPGPAHVPEATTPHWVPPRWARWTAVVVVLLVGCVTFGVTTAQAELPLGPHHARYEVTTTGLVVVDLGPLGTLQLDSPAPFHLGADVIVQEIPAELTSVSQPATLDALGDTLGSYLQFFSTPQRQIHRVVRALVVDAAVRTLAAMAVVALAGLAGYALLGAARRRELGEAGRQHTWALTTGTAVVVAALAIPASGVVDRENLAPGTPLLAGTPLAGARITGRLAGVVDTYGTQLVDAYRSSEAFYAAADENLVAAFDAADARQAVAALTPPVAPGVVPGGGARERPDAGTGSAGGEAGGGGAGGGGAATPAQPSPAVTPAADGLVTLLVISDLHCNTGMSPLIRTAVERTHADVVLNAGDTTINGTAVEQVCVDSFADAIPRRLPVVMANGNHDSPLIAGFARDAGWTVLTGDVVTVDGIRILGNTDARQTRIGSGSQQAGEVSPDEQAANLARTACEAAQVPPGDATPTTPATPLPGGPASPAAPTAPTTPTLTPTPPTVPASPAAPAPTPAPTLAPGATPGVDLLLIHDPRIGIPTMETGCVPAQVSGHLHRRLDPEQVGLGIRYVNSSTAGATLNQLTVGPLHGTAEMTVLRFDRAAHRFVDWQLVSVTKEGVASVGERTPWPVPGPAEVPAGPLPAGD